MSVVESLDTSCLAGKLTQKYGCRFSYALFFGSRNAKVVVNDVSVEAAQKVVDEVKKGEHYHDQMLAIFRR